MEEEVGKDKEEVMGIDDQRKRKDKEEVVGQCDGNR